MTVLEMAIVNIFKGRYSEPRLYETLSKAFIICIILVCLLQGTGSHRCNFIQTTNNGRSR